MVYEYACRKQGCERQDDTVEVTASLNASDSPVHCPGCLERMEKLISRNSFRLKGPRWARDGYGNKR